MQSRIFAMVPGPAFVGPPHGIVRVLANIVSTIVNAPLAAAGTVQGAKAGINVYLQNEQAPGMEFMDPKIVGYGIPAGGRLEVEMSGGY